MPAQLRVPREFRRGHRKDEAGEIRSAVALIDHVTRHFGLADLGDTAILDVGCGVKLTQALLTFDLPVGAYVGVDVYKAMIEFLRGNVDDPRFEFHHVNIHNARYNPTGERMTDDTRLPLREGATFDLVCLFSVFTHLAPHDYPLMLKLLRRYVRPEGRLLYSLYIDERTESGHGLMDGFAKQFGDGAVGKTVDFQDLKPDKPLDWALYSERFARELIEGTGWEVERLDPPNEFIQHHFTCRPVELNG
jgi:SAM-dependent methyltransferase